MRIIDRLDKYMIYSDINDNQITVNCGLSVGLLGKARQGKSDVGKKAIGKILNFYQDINNVWLLTGEGEMLKKSPQTSMINYENRGVPYYDVDFIAGFDLVENSQTHTPAYYIDFPEYNNATHWVNISGKSMEPLLSQGDIVAIKALPDWETYILYGEIYAIVTDEYRTVKRVRKAASGDKILLVPLNPDFDEQEIPKNIIRKVFQVQGCAKKIF